MNVMRNAVAVALSALVLAGCSAGLPGLAGPVGSPAAAPAPAAPPSAGESVAALQTAAQAYVAAVNADDPAAATELTCFRTGPGVLFEVASADADVQWQVSAPQIVEPRQGTVGIGVVGGAQQSRPLPFTFDGQRWCVDA